MLCSIINYEIIVNKVNIQINLKYLNQYKI